MTLNNSNVKREKNEKNACKEDGFTRVSYNVRYDWFGRKKKTEQVTNVRTTCVSTTIRIMRIDLQSSIETVPAFADHCSESNACWWPVVVTLSRFCSEQKYETRANNTRDRVLFRLLTDECARRHNNYFVARVTFRLQTATSRSGIRLGAVSLLPVARWSYIIYKHYYRIRTRGGGRETRFVQYNRSVLTKWQFVIFFLATRCWFDYGRLHLPARRWTPLYAPPGIRCPPTGRCIITRKIRAQTKRVSREWMANTVVNRRSNEIRDARDYCYYYYCTPP